jgi:hypothetical protein
MEMREDSKVQKERKVTKKTVEVIQGNKGKGKTRRDN